jgi:hypothetical protein
MNYGNFNVDGFLVQILVYQFKSNNSLRYASEVTQNAWHRVTLYMPIDSQLHNKFPALYAYVTM